MNLELQPPPRQQSTRSCRRVFLTFIIAAAGVVSVRSEPETNGIAASKTYLSDVCRELQKSWPTNRIINIVCHGHIRYGEKTVKFSFKENETKPLSVASFQ